MASINFLPIDDNPLESKKKQISIQKKFYLKKKKKLKKIKKEEFRLKNVKKIISFI